MNMTAGIAWVSWKTTVFTGFQCGHNSISCLLKKTEIDEAILLTFAIHEKIVHVLHVLDLFDLLKKKKELHYGYEFVDCVWWYFV